MTINPNGKQQTNPSIRLRIRFAKTAAMRYTSHLDLYRTWERTLRRAGLPLCYTQGFNPHPRVQLAAALPLGMTSSCELIDVWLGENDLSKAEIDTQLKGSVPPGIAIQFLEKVELNAPALQTQVLSAEYTAELLENTPGLVQRIQELLAQSTLPRTRRGKSYDLRPLIESLAIIAHENKPDQLIMRLKAQEGHTGRPEEVLLALDIPPENARLERTNIILA